MNTAMNKENNCVAQGSKRAYVTPIFELVEAEESDFLAASEDIEFENETSTSGGGQLEGGNFDELPEGSEILTRESKWDTNW